MNDMTQGSPAWFAERVGHVTASRFKDVLAKIKTGEAATRKTYRLQIVTERLTGLPAATFQGNSATEWGTATEPLARLAYEAHTGNIVEEIGFLRCAIPYVGCSPDGLIGEDGGVEIKSPYNSVVHVQTLEEGMPSEHKPQVQGAMWVTGRKWWDFVSFDPRLPRGLQLYVQRIERDDDYIRTLDAEVISFLLDVQKDYDRLLALMDR